MSQLIRKVMSSELDDLLALNESEVPHVGRIDIERMHWFANNADYFGVATQDEEIAGFLIGIWPGSAYQSPNYLWFQDRYDNFAYVDRVAVAESARGHGIASKLYADFAAKSPNNTETMTCEVNILPPNEGSMKFHSRLGFRKVGTLSSDDGNKKVALLLKDL